MRRKESEEKRRKEGQREGQRGTERGTERDRERDREKKREGQREGHREAEKNREDQGRNSLSVSQDQTTRTHAHPTCQHHTQSAVFFKLLRNPHGFVVNATPVCRAKIIHKGERETLQ